MRCYNCDKFGHKSQDYMKSRRQLMKNNPYKLGRKSNELWKKRREDKSQRTNVENKSSSNRVPYERYGEENQKQKARKMMKILHLKMKKLITIN
jgi:hypothetical protein